MQEIEDLDEETVSEIQKMFRNKKIKVRPSDKITRPFEEFKDSLIRVGLFEEYEPDWKEKVKDRAQTVFTSLWFISFLRFLLVVLLGVCLISLMGMFFTNSRCSSAIENGDTQLITEYCE